MTAIDLEGVPGEWLRDAVLRAADASAIGVCVSRATESRVVPVFVNDAACTILGFSREELLARNAMDNIAPEELSRLDELRRTQASGPRLAPITCIQKNGARVSVEFATASLELDGSRILVSFFLDGSMRREVEREQAASEARVRRIIEGAPDGVVISRAGVVVFANERAAAQLGCARASELLGRSFGDFLDKEQLARMRERTGRIAAGQTLEPTEYTARTPDGRVVTVEISTLPIDFDGGPAMLAFSRDVTARVQSREELARTDRLVSLGTLAAGVAHEINNPLTFMSLGVGLLKTRIAASGLEEPARAALLSTLADVQSGADRVGAIVRELAAFSRIDKYQPRPVDVRAVADAAIRFVAHRTRHVARVICRVPELPPAIADAGRLEQVLVNLLLNASQALEGIRSDGTIELTASQLDASRIAIEVSDDGAGIPTEVVGRVFDPFFTTKTVGEGTGLGLAVCHGLIHQMGGEITVTSVRGATKFRVLIPIATERQEAPPHAGSAAKARRRLLIVDDEPLVVASLVALLGTTHDVVTAKSGAEAAAQLESDRTFDAVICDLSMPGMSGAELRERVSSLPSGIASRFVLMTGGAVTDESLAQLKRWKGPLLEKPFRVEELEAALEEVDPRR